MPRSWPEAQREMLGRPLLRRLGVHISPEFGAALFPAPREKLITGGWQAGKSMEGAAEILLDAPLWFEQARRFLYWIIVPSYETPHKELDYLAEWAQQLGIRHTLNTPQNGACKLTMLGGRVVVETKTAQNMEGIAGEPCDGVLVVEAGQIPGTVQDAAQGRVMTRRGWIVYTGTLEDDEGRPRWAWYAENAEAWFVNGADRDERSFALPSWANALIFSGGEHDAEIERLRARLDEFTFNRRIAARPTGVQNQVYPQVTRKKLLLPMPEGLRWTDGAGGIDFGTAHPSALTVVTLASNGDAWVRHCEFLKGREQGSEDAADFGLIEWHKNMLSQRYEVGDPPHRIGRWGLDPNVRHSGLDDADPVKGSQGARGGRIALVTKRLNTPSLYFDLNGPGVPELYYEMGRVHFRKTQQGEWVLWRMHDDRTASFEDAIEMLDGPNALPASFGATDMQEREPAPPYRPQAGELPDPIERNRQQEQGVGLDAYGGRRSR